jgi:hypothetical protein
MPWRCAFESPLVKGGGLDPGLCDPHRSDLGPHHGYTRSRSLLFQAPNGQTIGSPKWYTGSTNMVEDHVRKPHKRGLLRRSYAVHDRHVSYRLASGPTSNNLAGIKGGGAWRLAGQVSSVRHGSRYTFAAPVPRVRSDRIHAVFRVFARADPMNRVTTYKRGASSS